MKKIGIYIVLFLVLIVFLFTRPKTIERGGNGYSHQIGNFGKCDNRLSDDCTDDAEHRLHHIFGNEDYCNACWEYYGEEWFYRISNYEGKEEKTCAWCNGTGYNGNGATNPTEYVLKKTPCEHCDGKGKIK